MSWSSHARNSPQVAHPLMISAPPSLQALRARPQCAPSLPLQESGCYVRYRFNCCPRRPRAMSTSSMQAHAATLRRQFEPLVRFCDAAWSLGQDRFNVRTFDAGTAIITAGDHVREIGFVLRGLVRYYYLTAKGKELNKSFGGPGQPISSVSSLVAKQPSPFFVEALEPCVAMFIDYAVLLELCELHCDWERFVRALLERLAIRKERREADLLMLSAQQRYIEFLAEYEQLAERIPNYHIASYLGITDVALSRIRRRIGMTHARINKG